MPDGGFLDSENTAEEPTTVQEAPAVVDVNVQQVGATQSQEQEVIQEQPAVQIVEQPDVLQEPSALDMDERAFEAIQEQEKTERFLEESDTQAAIAITQSEGGVLATSSGSTTAIKQAVRQKDEVVISVLRILEQDLGNYYSHMPEDAKKQFHSKGEEIAFEIADMIRKLQVRLKEVLHLIWRWLQTIPGVNKFFLEQESKIKTDQIFALQASRQTAQTA